MIFDLEPAGAAPAGGRTPGCGRDREVACASRTGVVAPSKYQPVISSSNEHADAVRQLHVQERLRAADWWAAARLGARQRVIEAELRAPGLRVENAQAAPFQAAPTRSRHAPVMYLPTMKSSSTLRISSWNGVKSFNWKWSCSEAREHQALDQAHQLVAALEPAVGLVARIAGTRPAEVVVVADHVHAPDAVRASALAGTVPASYSAS